MRKIVAINGSPKRSKGLSELIINMLAEFSGNKIESYKAVDLVAEDLGTLPPDIAGADILLVVFPLYVDSLPAPLIKALKKAEAAITANSVRPTVFAISNCGFFEARQTTLALQMVRAFAQRAGCAYGYGLGIGAGPMLAVTDKGPTANIVAALKDFAKALCQEDPQEKADVFLSPRFPSSLYKLAAHSGWYRSARKAGQRKQLAARPHGN